MTACLVVICDLDGRASTWSGALLKPAALATTILVLASVAASAADPPIAAAPFAPRAVPSLIWHGFYVGTSTGGLAMRGDVGVRALADSTAVDISTGRRPASVSLSDGSNLVSSAQLGINVQFGSLVFGIEADASWADVSRKAIFPSAAGDLSFFRQDLGVLATLRGRAGVAFENVLLYGTAGVAGGTVQNRVAFLRAPDFAFEHAGSRRDTSAGYVVGGGVEVLLPQSLQQWALLGRLLGASSVTVRAEYLYFDLGSENVRVHPVAGANNFTSRFDTSGHMGRIGFNYRFGP